MVNDITYVALIDTGSILSIINSKVASNSTIRPCTGGIVTTPNGTIDVAGYCDVELNTGPVKAAHSFVEFPDFYHSILLDMDFLVKNNVNINLSKGHIILGDAQIPLFNSKEKRRVFVINKIVLAPRAEDCSCSI